MNVKIIILLIFLLQSCKARKNYDSRQEKDNTVVGKVEKIESQNPPELDFFVEKEYTSYINCDSYKELAVKTTYINVSDIISPYRPLIINQELFFYKEGVKVTFPFNKRRVDLNGKPTEVFDTAICKVKCHRSEKGNWLYNIYGINNFDPPHEFFGLISPQGEWLWYYYGDRYDIYKSYGNNEEYIEEYGEELNSLKDMKQVCPD